MNIWDILILLAVAAAIGAAIRIMRGKKTPGGCGCGCSGCTRECSARKEPADAGKSPGKTE